MARRASALEEAPGLSVFYKDEAGEIFHTYSTYARGLDPLIGTYHFLDLVPKGRDEDGLAFSMSWVRHHDQYGDDYVLDPAANYEKPREMGACCKQRGACVMTAQCCTGEGPSRRLARRSAGAAASILPGAMLVLLPKCPLCLAAWLTVVTGVGVSATAAAHVRGLIVVVWVVAAALAAVQIIRRRALRGQVLPRSRVTPT